VGPTKYGAVYRTDIDPHAENAGQPKRIVQFMKWGLVPSYFKDDKKGGRMFNCREESLAENRSVWSGPKKHHRCLVFVEGYYEWLKEGKNRIPYYVKRKDGKLLCLAGLWDRNTAGGNELYSFTIITTAAHESVKWLHDRMPVIINPDDKLVDKWLDPTIIWKDKSAEFVSLIKPFHSSGLEVYEVSSEVNRIGNDNPDMNKPVKNSARRPLASDFFQGRAKRDHKEKDEKDNDDVKNDHEKDHVKNDDEKKHQESGKNENEKIKKVHVKSEDDDDNHGERKRKRIHEKEQNDKKKNQEVQTTLTFVKKRTEKQQHDDPPASRLRSRV
jgi:putative SOS response-associated peptidase YedK